VTRLVLAWFIVGCLAAGFLIAIQARAVGGDPAHLLAAGSGPLQPLVSEELQFRDWDPAFTHDGHRFYAVAMDPLGSEVPELMLNPAYRYQRIAYPIVAGIGGLLGGSALLWSMIVWSALGMAVAVGATAAIAERLDLPPLTPLLIVANPGIWLGVQLLTGDVLAAALLLTAVVFWLDETPTATVALLIVAALTKEIIVLVAISWALFEWSYGESRHRAAALASSVVPAGLWFVWLQSTMGDGVDSGENITWPFAGIIAGLRGLSGAPERDRIFTALALAMLIAGIYFLLRRRNLWSYLGVPFALAGILGSHWIWSHGNNALRIIAPLGVFAGLALLDRRQTASRPASP
jgi:hypothetical protein